MDKELPDLDNNTGFTNPRGGYDADSLSYSVDENLKFGAYRESKDVEIDFQLDEDEPTNR